MLEVVLLVLYTNISSRYSLYPLFESMPLRRTPTDNGVGALTVLQRDRMQVGCLITYCTIYVALPLYGLQVYPRTTCLFVGSRCKDLHLVDVFPLAGTRMAVDHTDLDVFSWCPGMPHYCDSFVDMDSHCYTHTHKSFDEHGAPLSIVYFTFMFYDQASFYYAHCRHVNGVTYSMCDAAGSTHRSPIY